MTDTKTEALEFDGFSGKIPAYLLSRENSGKKLAVVFPGAGYSYRQPLLHFAVRGLLDLGFNVLALDKIYNDDPVWRDIESEPEARKIVQEDAKLVASQITAEFGQPHTLLGRSLGTFAIACILEDQLFKPHQIVWQTPALGQKWEIMQGCNIRSFGILGTADYYYGVAFPILPKDRIVIEGADHGMEIAGNALKSIDALKTVTEATMTWISSGH